MNDKTPINDALSPSVVPATVKGMFTCTSCGGYQEEGPDEYLHFVYCPLAPDLILTANGIPFKNLKPSPPTK